MLSTDIAKLSQIHFCACSEQLRLETDMGFIPNDKSHNDLEDFDRQPYLKSETFSFNNKMTINVFEKVVEERLGFKLITENAWPRIKNQFVLYRSIFCCNGLS